MIPIKTELEKNVSDPNFTDPALQQQEPQAQQTAAPEPQQQTVNISPDLEAGPPPVPKTRGTLTIAFGRFNPPHAFASTIDGYNCCRC